MQHLYDKLKEYAADDYYPYHMPGHKRRLRGNMPESFFDFDITEIDGFDNLHQAEAILKELQQKAAEYYGAEETFYLVNGSTSGILSAISAVLPAGGHLLMARNCHKSAYHGVYLRNLTVSYLYPSVLEEYDINDAITPAQVREALDAEPDIGAVLIVSPTYEGRIADVKAIADIVHEKGLPLIVDEAHGAHLGWSNKLPCNSCQAGADIVIHSVHKTLPSMTQTALLHVNGHRIDREMLRRFLHIYQSSSPSYVLMASIDNALNIMAERGEELIAGYIRNFEEMMNRLAVCKCLEFLPWDHDRQDVGKLVISSKKYGLSGQDIYDILLKRYHLQLEMAAESYCLAMFSVADTEEGYVRLTEALLEIDREMQQGKRPSRVQAGKVMPEEARKKATLRISEAWNQESEYVYPEEAVGKIAADFVNLYPPGIPLLVPGEIVTSKLCNDVQTYLTQGLTVQGVTIREGKYQLKVLQS